MSARLSPDATSIDPHRVATWSERLYQFTYIIHHTIKPRARTFFHALRLFAAHHLNPAHHGLVPAYGTLQRVHARPHRDLRIDV